MLVLRFSPLLLLSLKQNQTEFSARLNEMAYSDVEDDVQYQQVKSKMKPKHPKHGPTDHIYDEVYDDHDRYFDYIYDFHEAIRNMYERDPCYYLNMTILPTFSIFV
jgi:hypothetical protein